MSILTLMNANYEVAKILYATSRIERLSVVEILDSDRLPFGLQKQYGKMNKLELNNWWRCRSILRSCPGLEIELSFLGLDKTCDAAPRGLGLSLSDCYWLRPEGAETLRWEDVNYFDNDYITTAPKGWDYRLSGIVSNSSSGVSEVELPKKWIIGAEGTRILLKGCRRDDQRPYNELVATRLFKRLLSSGEYVPYSVVQTDDGPASACPNFLRSHEEFIPAAALWKVMERVSGENRFERLCAALGAIGIEESDARRYFTTMVICDVLLANIDRHWRNFGVVRNVDTLDLRLAPLFDTGNCLWYSASNQDIERGLYQNSSQPIQPNRLEQLTLSHLGLISQHVPDRLEGFIEQACELLSASSHVSKPGRLEFIHEGLNRNMELLANASTK